MNRYEGDFPKLSKSNSISFNGMLFYFKKIDGCYVAFEYKTKIQINHSFEKEVLISRSTTKFIKGALVDTGSICQMCQEVMEFIRPGEGFTTHMTGSDNICKR